MSHPTLVLLMSNPPIPHAPDSPERHPAKRVSILDAAPIYRLLDAFTEQLSFLKAVVPLADATTLMQRATDELTVAVKAGESGAVWVDVVEASSALGISEQAVTLRCRNGQLAAQKLGSRWCVLLSSLR